MLILFTVDDTDLNRVSSYPTCPKLPQLTVAYLKMLGLALMYVGAPRHFVF